MQKDNFFTTLTVLVSFLIVVGFFHQWILTF
jgi:hypothetical protein